MHWKTYTSCSHEANLQSLGAGMFLVPVRILLAPSSVAVRELWNTEWHYKNISTNLLAAAMLVLQTPRDHSPSLQLSLEEFRGLTSNTFI